MPGCSTPDLGVRSARVADDDGLGSGEVNPDWLGSGQAGDPAHGHVIDLCDPAAVARRGAAATRVVG